MSKAYGYKFYFAYLDESEIFTFPITPGELTISVGSNNKTVTLINEGDINILKSPALVEVSFEARFPMRQYPYARKFTNFQTYFDKFKKLKSEKIPFRFIVARETPDEVDTWDTNLLVALEEIEFKEDADEGDDVLIDFTLKQYKEYGVVKIDTSKIKQKRKRANKVPGPTKYVVQDGDSLYTIAKKQYNAPERRKDIYEANQEIIEETAEGWGRKDSWDGHWIYPGCELQLPGLKPGLYVEGSPTLIGKYAAAGHGLGGSGGGTGAGRKQTGAGRKQTGAGRK